MAEWGHYHHLLAGGDDISEPLSYHQKSEGTTPFKRQRSHDEGDRHFLHQDSDVGFVI